MGKIVNALRSESLTVDEAIRLLEELPSDGAPMEEQVAAIEITKRYPECAGLIDVEKIWRNAGQCAVEGNPFYYEDLSILLGRRMDAELLRTSLARKIADGDYFIPTPELDAATDSQLREILRLIWEALEMTPSSAGAITVSSLANATRRIRDISEVELGGILGRLFRTDAARDRTVAASAAVELLKRCKPADRFSLTVEAARLGLELVLDMLLTLGDVAPWEQAAENLREAKVTPQFELRVLAVGSQVTHRPISQRGAMLASFVHLLSLGDQASALDAAEIAAKAGDDQLAEIARKHAAEAIKERR